MIDETAIYGALSALPIAESEDPLFSVLTERAVRRGRAIRARRRTTLAALPALLAVGAGITVLPARAPNRHVVGAINNQPALLRIAATTELQPAAGRDAPFWFVAASAEFVHPNPETGLAHRTGVDVTPEWLGHWAPSIYHVDGRRTPGEPFSLRSADAKTRIDWDALYALPTDTTVLKAYLEKLFPPDPESGQLDLWRAIGDLLARSPAPPSLRAALYRVAATLPGMSTAVGRDSTGRSALIVSNSYLPVKISLSAASDAGAVGRYYVDENTGMLLESEELAGAYYPLIPPGTVMSRITYRAAGPVPDNTTVLPLSPVAATPSK